MRLNLLISFLLVLALCGVGRSQEINTDVDFCQLALPEWLKQANASFYLIVTFQLDKDGRPINIKRLDGELSKHVAEAAVIACVKRWTITGLPPNAKIVATWRWNHGVGWEKLRVTTPRLTQRIKVSGNRCPYTKKDV
jgi:hypothetical protein